jgi:hypothetical protein
MITLAGIGYLYLVRTIRAEERRAFPPFKQMAEARAVAIRKHRAAVRRAAVNQVYKELKEHTDSLIHGSLEDLQSSERISAFCIDLLDDSQSRQALQKAFGEPSESEILAAKVCAESAIRDAERYVDLSESFEKRR